MSESSWLRGTFGVWRTGPATGTLGSLVRIESPGDRYAYYLSRLRALRVDQWCIASSGWITLLYMEILAPGSPARVLLVFGFVLVCPGLAVAGLVPTRELAERWVLAFALSVSLGLLVSVAFTVVRDDSVMHRMVTLAVITTTAVIATSFASQGRDAPSSLTHGKGQR